MKSIKTYRLGLFALIKLGIIALLLSINIQACTPDKNEYTIDENSEYVEFSGNEKSGGLIFLWALLIFLIAAGIVFILFQEDYLLSKKAKSGGVNLSILQIRKLKKEIFQNPKSKKNKKEKLSVEKIIEFLAVSKKEKLGVKLKDLQILYHRKIKLQDFIDTLKKAKNPEFGISPKFLKEYYLGNENIEEIMIFYIAAKDYGLEITLDNIAEFSMANINIEKLIFALKSLKNAGININIDEMQEKYFIKNDVVKVIMAAHLCTKNKLDIPLKELEDLYISKGDVEQVVEALVKAQNAKIDVNFGELADINLSGYDPVDVIEKTKNPRIIDVGVVKAMTKDRYPILISAKITVRNNLKEFIVGAKEETVIYRVREGISSAIGTFKTHKEIFENPRKASSIVMGKHLDKGTMLKIISVEIGGIETGEEIDIDLKVRRAELEKIIAKANSEKRKIEADISAQEARVEIKRAEARVKQAEAKLREAEARIREIDAKIKREGSALKTNTDLHK